VAFQKTTSMKHPIKIEEAFHKLKAMGLALTETDPFVIVFVVPLSNFDEFPRQKVIYSKNSKIEAENPKIIQYVIGLDPNDILTAFDEFDISTIDQTIAQLLDSVKKREDFESSIQKGLSNLTLENKD
jgi:hypothetical protein